VDEVMLSLNGVTFAYRDSEIPALRDVNLRIEKGQFVLVVGPSGSGKSTLLRTVNGLVPHFSGGRICGSVRVARHDPIAEGPHAMSPIVGFVQQDPESQFVVDRVEDELAFAMENQGLQQALMRARVEEVLIQLNITHLRHRPITSLSAGEKQRVAIGSVLTLRPRVLVLDEPTSQLDPQAAEEVLITCRQLNRDLGLTVVLSEHRLERVVQYADRVIYLPTLGESPVSGKPREMLIKIPFAPPLVQLAKALHWEPIPLTIEAAQPFCAELRLRPVKQRARQRPEATSIEVRDLWYDYHGIEALRGLNLRAGPGELVALMGRNGSGKTTLLKHLVGLLCPKRGAVRVNGSDTRQVSIDTLIKQVGYVPQDPSSLLFADTVRQELEFTRRAHGLTAVDTSPWLTRLGLAGLAGRYPRAMSVGERQRAALAAILVAEPSVLLLDEPTRGLDPVEKQALADFLRQQAKQGRTVILATHDVELAAQAAQRVVILDRGQVLADGPVREVMSQSEEFSPQVSRLFRDPWLLTAQDVLEARSSES
jgi:energy-coupling factor transporter ATP-binding protein EcfA2